MSGIENGQILYVGPTTAARRDASRLEAELGGSVDVLTDASEVFDRLDADEPACVVVGREVATRDGVDLLRSVREQYGDLPVVLAPAENGVTVARDAVAHGVDGYVPYEGDDPPYDELSAHVRRAVDGRDVRPQTPQDAAFRRLAQQIAPTSAFVTDGDGTVVWANERARDRLDVDAPDESSSLDDVALYDADGDWVPPDDRPNARAVRDGDVVENRLYRIERPTGHRWISVSAAPVDATGEEYTLVRDGSSGEFEYAVVVSEDVTDRQRYARQLERERDELATELDDVYRRISDAFFALDDEWRFTHLNERAEELIDVAADDVRGESLWDVFPGAVGSPFEGRFRGAMESQSPVTVVAEYPPLDSWFEVHVYPSETGLSVYFRDVSEKVEHERELERRAEQQTTVAELGQRALETTDLDALFEEAVTAVAETLDNDFAKVLDRRSERGDLLLRAGVGWQDGLVGSATVPADRDSQAGYTLEGDSPVIVEDIAAEHRFSGPDLLLDHDVTSGISVVIGPPDDPWGVLTTHDREPRAYGEEDANFVQGVANVLATAIERHRRENELERQRERLAALEEVNTVTRTINYELAGQSTREEIERVVCARLADSDSYEFAWIGDVEDGAVVVRQEAGVEGYLDDVTITVDGEHGTGPTGRALRTGETQVVRDVQTDPDYEQWTDHASEMGYRSSAAAPVVHQDRQYGVLNVYASRPGAFDGREREAVSQLGRVVGMAITAVERGQKLRARERQYRTLVENLPDGSVGMFDTNLRYTRVGGNLYEQFPLLSEELVGRHVHDVETVPADLRDRLTDAYADTLQGESRSLEAQYDGRTFEIRTAPLTEDGSVSGGMALVQDITTRKRREVELERQHERLAFVNRILRHNLLNGLNVVQSRASLLEGFVDPEAMTHLETVRERAEEMTEFVGMMRSFMQIVSPDEDHQLEPRRLDDVLDASIRKLRRDHGDVAVRCDDLPSVTVEADALLDAVFENVLTNAVQHNDRPVAEVDVSVDVSEEDVAVSVADNGPGIPAAERARIFERGVSGDPDPGSGFGLYLVRETVRKYGGEVAIDDDEPRGTVVTVVLPLADE